MNKLLIACFCISLVVELLLIGVLSHLKDDNILAILAFISAIIHLPIGALTGPIEPFGFPVILLALHTSIYTAVSYLILKWFKATETP